MRFFIMLSLLSTSLFASEEFNLDGAKEMYNQLTEIVDTAEKNYTTGATVIDGVVNCRKQTVTQKREPLPSRTAVEHGCRVMTSSLSDSRELNLGGESIFNELQKINGGSASLDKTSGALVQTGRVKCSRNRAIIPASNPEWVEIFNCKISTLDSEDEE
jgi:hypothetical protein